MKIRLIILLALIGQMTFAQDILTKAEAIEQFLASNFDIRLSLSQVDLAQASASKKAVGYYPTVTLSGGANYDYGTANQLFQDGREINADGNLTQVYNAGVAVNYSIYQGGQRKYRLNQLMAQVALADVQKRQQIEAGLLQFLQFYHQAAQLQKQADIQARQVDLSRAQLEKTRIGIEYGRGNRADVLTAEANFLRDSTRMYQLQVDRDIAKRNLVNLLGQSSANIDFAVSSELVFNVLPNIEDLIREAVDQNATMSLLDRNEEVLSYDRKLIDAQRRPTLGASADYQYQFQDFGEGGFFAQQRSNGVGAGLNLSWNLFDGGLAQNQKQVWRVRKDQLDIQKDQARTTIENNMVILKSQLDAARKLIEVEEKNVRVAIQNLERAQQQYDLGGQDLLIVRTAQTNLSLSENTLQQALFNAKNLELQLIQQWGRLLSEETLY